MWLDKEKFLFCKGFKLILKPKQPPIQWVPGSLPARVKRLECEAEKTCHFMKTLK